MIQRNPLDSNAPLTYGERVAIKIAGGGYLVRSSPVWGGVNLGWSSTPAYQWEFPAPRSDLFGTEIFGDSALWNAVEGDFLVYRSGRIGIDLGWYREVAGPTPIPVTDPFVIIGR